ncbi:MAG: hypothetical protein V3U49_02495 [Nitrososphaerales archaeon]
MASLIREKSHGSRGIGKGSIAAAGLFAMLLSLLMYSVTPILTRPPLFIVGVEGEETCSTINLRVENRGDEIHDGLFARAEVDPVSPGFSFAPNDQPLDVIGPRDTSDPYSFLIQTEGVPRGTYSITLTLYDDSRVIHVYPNAGRLSCTVR